LLSGCVAHAAGHSPSLATAAAGLLLAVHGHAGGWGFPVGGSQAIADALIAELAAHGGVVRSGEPVESLAGLPPSRVTLLDTSPRLLLTAELPPRYERAVRSYRYGSGAAKVDFALSGPVPWKNADVALAPTVHLGGSRAEITAAENSVERRRIPSHPYVLVAQPSVLDTKRAPAGRHTLWAYIHVPPGSDLYPTLPGLVKGCLRLQRAPPSSLPPTTPTASVVTFMAVP
jgi:phytoene dehydrogenase-like protein